MATTWFLYRSLEQQRVGFWKRQTPAEKWSLPQNHGPAVKLESPTGTGYQRISHPISLFAEHKKGEPRYRLVCFSVSPAAIQSSSTSYMLHDHNLQQQKHTWLASEAAAEAETIERSKADKRWRPRDGESIDGSELLRIAQCTEWTFVEWGSGSNFQRLRWSIGHSPYHETRWTVAGGRKYRPDGPLGPSGRSRPSTSQWRGDFLREDRALW